MLYTSVYYTPDAIVESAFKHIRDNSKAFPDGRVVLYGYSYGGVIANKLAEKLQKEGINVNLMITVDAANGPMSNWIDREVSENVLSNLNFYQNNLTLLDPTASHGDKNSGRKVFNVNKSKDKYKGEKINHMNIDDATFGISQKAIMELIKNSESGKRTLTKEEINNLFNR